MAATTKFASGFRVYHRRYLKLGAGVKAIPGTICGFATSGAAKGYIVDGGYNGNIQVLGRFGGDTIVDNTAGANGAASQEVQFGRPFECHRLLNDTVAPLLQTDCGSVCFVKDNNTLTAEDSSNPAYGILIELEGSEVYAVPLFPAPVPAVAS